MINKPVLSICIATYNRGQEVYNKINEILSYNSPEIEVVVSDNGSTDNTVELLSNIKNKNFTLVKNTENKGPVFNYIKSLANGSGKYIVFVTDKDSLDLRNIDFILNYLKQASFAVGYFALDYQKDRKVHINEYKSEKECLNQFGYLSKHPTGYIYNNKYLKELDIESNYIDIDKVGYFPFEFIAADLAKKSFGVIINIYFCKTSPIPTDRNTFSATYSSKNNNIFFSPKARMEHFERYISHLSKLDICSKSKKYMYKKLLQKTYKLSIRSYASIMKDTNKCHYYQIKQEVINKKRMKELHKDFFRYVKQSQILSNSYNLLDIIKYKLRIFKVR